MQRKTFVFEGKRYDVKAKTSQELGEKLANKKRDLEEGRVLLNKSTLVKGWAMVWFSTYKENVGGIANDRKYLGILNNHILPEIGNKRVMDVMPVDLQRIMNNQRGKSSDHIRRVYYVLNHMFSRAQKNKMRIDNPADELDIPKGFTHKRRAVTEEELSHTFKLWDHHPCGLLLKWMYYCGLRPQEVVVLTWGDIDFDEKEVCISKARKSRTRTAGTPKTEAGIRVLPIPDVFLMDLQKIKGHPAALIMPFPHNGKVYTESATNLLWHDFKRELDISMGAKVFKGEIVKSVVAKDLVPYCYRHTFCSHTQELGVSPHIVKDWMGHTDIKVTNGYTHASKRAIKGAVELINQYHSSNLDSQKTPGI